MEIKLPLPIIPNQKPPTPINPNQRKRRRKINELHDYHGQVPLTTKPKSLVSSPLPLLPQPSTTAIPPNLSENSRKRNVLETETYTSTPSG